jgi:phosphate acetyltransferase
MILEKFAQEAKQLKGTIVFGEGDEERTLAAAVKLTKEGICKCVVVAEKKELVLETAKKKGLDISGLTVLEPSFDLLEKTAVDAFVQGRVNKGMPEEEAKKLALNPLFFSALYIKSGEATGGVNGARSATSDVIRAAIYGLGAIKGTKIISSFFLMAPPENHPVIKKPIIYADCGVNPDPNALSMRDIAVASVRSFKSLFPQEEPRVAFLSFSTKGSAEHKTLEKIIEAVKLTKEFFASDPSVRIDGELQFDAAVIPAVGERKAPGSPVAGHANVFIFPDLNAGNICYKVTERLGQFMAIGPLIQGVAKPFNDLSRGCKIEDIYYAAVVALLQSRS